MVTLYRDAMQTYALDGLKLDFIDEFYFGSDTAFPTDDMDIPVLEDAMFRLMCDIHDIVIDSLLEAPEYYSPEYTISETGEVSYTGELEPNPDYIPEGSPKRAFSASSWTLCLADRPCRSRDIPWTAPIKCVTMISDSLWS